MSLYAGKIISWNPDKKRVEIEILDDISYEMLQKQVNQAEIRLIDAREVSAEQRRKSRAIVGEISKWSGHEPEYIHEMLKWEYCAREDIKHFSMRDTDRTTAKGFIDYLIKCCLEWNVPTRMPLITQAEDVGKYLYWCCGTRRCAICGRENSDIHHVDRIGMGRNRNELCHIGMKIMCLCREHHTECHTMGQGEFDERFKTFGIKADEYLVDVLKLGITEREVNNDGK